jgi:hypothetical protein
MMKFSSTLNAAVILVVVVASTPTTATTTASTGASITASSPLRGVVAHTASAAAVSVAVKTSTTRDLSEQERIVGGDQSKEGEFPYFVGMGGW